MLGEDVYGDVDFFVAELSSDGDLRWIEQFGSADNDGVPGLTTDADGNLYASGSTFGDVAGPHLGGRGDVFLLKIDPSQIPEPSSGLCLVLALLVLRGSCSRSSKATTGIIV